MQWHFRAAEPNRGIGIGIRGGIARNILRKHNPSQTALDIRPQPRNIPGIPVFWVAASKVESIRAATLPHRVPKAQEDSPG